jgi:hypothetical protein
MMLFAIRIEDTFNVTVQGSHNADSREHRRPAAALRHQHQRFDRGLPFVTVGFFLGELTRRGLRENEKRWRIGLPGACDW